MSPDTGSGYQVGSLPSSISESVDVAIGQSVEDLSLDETDPLVDHQSLLMQGEEVRGREGGRGRRGRGREKRKREGEEVEGEGEGEGEVQYKGRGEREGGGKDN